MVYQQLVNMGKIEYKDKKKKMNVWMSGVFFYTMAWPMVITSNFMYWVDITKISRWMYTKTHSKFEWLNVQNQSFHKDINEKLMIEFEK